jgi:monoamine oxidase
MAAVLAPLLEDVEVLLAFEASAISVVDGGVEVRARDGRRVHAAACVCTLPLGVLQASVVTFAPPLHDERRACVARLGVARYTKVWLTWPAPWWRSEDGRPFIICVDAGQSHMGTVVCEDVSSPDGFVLEACLAGSDADAFDADPSRGLAAILTRLGVAFGARYPGPPTATDATAWQADPLARGAYSFWKVGARATDVSDASRPHAERVFFAGEHASVEYQGSMCGALEAGRRAADEAEALLSEETPRAQS